MEGGGLFTLEFVGTKKTRKMGFVLKDKTREANTLFQCAMVEARVELRNERWRQAVCNSLCTKDNKSRYL